MTTSFSFSKLSNTSDAIAFPGAGLTLTLEGQSFITTGTVKVPTHAYVPIPNGALGEDFSLGLYENGVRIIAQVETIQTWNFTDRPKWLHVHFIGTYDNGIARTYVLKSETLPDSPPGSTLTCDETSTTITVQNGTIKYVVSKAAFCGIQQLWYDSTGTGTYGAAILDSTAGGPLYTSNTGAVWSPKYDSTCSVIVERNGPVKVTIKARGAYQTRVNATNPQMYFTTRITLYAGLAWIDFQHTDTAAYWKDDRTFVNSTITTNNGVDRPIYDLQFAFPMSGGQTYHFGIDGDQYAGSLGAVTPSLVDKMAGFWTMEEASGTRYGSTFQNNLTAAASTLPTSTTGKIGNAALFVNTSSNYLTSTDASLNLGGDNSFAISLWVKLTTKGTFPIIVSKYDQNLATNRCFYLAFNAATDKFEYAVCNTSGAHFTVSSASGISTGTWYHIIIQYNATTKASSLIINGITVAGTTLTGTLCTTICPFVLGTMSIGVNPLSAIAVYGLNGAIDSVGVWNRILTAGEIATLYNSGTGTDYPFGLSILPVGNTDTAYLHQYKYNALRLLGVAEPDDTDDLQKSDGWAAVHTATTRFNLFTKYAWQKYPKEFELNANGLSYHFWPQHGMNVFSEDERLSFTSLFRSMNFHHGAGLETRIPIEHCAMMWVGPGSVCTFNSTTDLVTTTVAHGWSTGQAVQFIIGNESAVLPTSTPQIATNTYIYTGTGRGNPSGAYYAADGDFLYINVQSATTFYLYDTLVHAQAGTGTGRVNITANGSGTLLVGTTRYQDEANPSENYPPGAYTQSMWGVNMLNDFGLIFNPTATAFNNDAYQRLYEYHPIARPSTTWCGNSNTIGPMSGKGSDFPEVETAIEDSMVGLYNYERTKDYGQFNYGDIHHQWFTDENRSPLFRNWFSSHYFILESLWTYYFHSQSSSILRLGRLAADHYTSSDTLYLTHPVFTQLNGIHVANHSKGITHWGGAAAGWEHWGDYDGVLYAWLIDANDWYKDTYNGYHNTAYIYKHPYLDMSIDTVQTRDYVSPLKRLCTMFEHTGDSRLLMAINSISQAARDHLLTDQIQAGSVWHPLWLSKYYETSRDPSYSDFIVDSSTGPIVWGTNSQTSRTNVGNVMGGVQTIGLKAKAYEITEDSDLLMNHIYYAANHKNTITNLPGTNYDNFGQRPGVLAEGYLWMCWSHYLRQLRIAGITEPDLSDAPDYYGCYLSGFSTMNDEQKSLTIYVLKTVDQPWNATLVYFNLPGQDPTAVGFYVKNPSNSVFFQLPLGVNPQIYTGTFYEFTINTSTDILTRTTSNFGGWLNGQFVYLQTAASPSSTISLTISTAGITGTFTASESVTQAGSGATGTYSSRNGNTLSITNVTGTFNSSGVITGGTSGATATANASPVISTHPDPDSQCTLPISTPQVELKGKYFVRMLSTTTLKLFTTSQDAYNNTNAINFSTTGSNLMLSPRGEPYAPPSGYGYHTWTYELNSDGTTGLYTIYIGGSKHNIFQPLTNLPECCAVHNSSIVTIKQLYTRGYLVPIRSYPIDLTFTPFEPLTGAEVGVNVKITDANGDTVVETSLLLGQTPTINDSVTVTINNDDGYDAPWFLDIFSQNGFTMTATPVNGETDEKLFLYGSNLSHINTIKTALGF